MQRAMPITAGILYYLSFSAGAGEEASSQRVVSVEDCGRWPHTDALQNKKNNEKQ
jgi:hypothetical protein